MEGGKAGHAQGSGDEADEIADDASTECKDSVPGALLHYEKVFDGGLSLARLGRLTGWDDMGNEVECSG